MSDSSSPLTPTLWSALLGIFATATLGWVGATSKKTSEHAVKIAVLETDVKYIKAGIDRLEMHLGTKPSE
jgi:hypothetical protein